MDDVKSMLSVILAVTALSQDLKNGKIPNRLILAGAAAAVILCLFPGCSLPETLAGAALPLLFPGILFFFRMTGAGDVKLLCVLGAILGSAASCSLILRSFGLGAVQALVVLMVRRNAVQRFHVLAAYLRNCIRCRKLLPYTDRSPAGRMRFSVSILGAVLWYALEKRLC